MQKKELSPEMLSAVTGGVDESEITINIKTLKGDTDEYSIKHEDKISDIISKYDADKRQNT